MKALSIFTLLLLTVTSIQALPLDKLQLPPDYKIQIYGTAPGARSMTIGENDIVYVGTISEGNVYALLPNKNHSGATQVIKIATGLNVPNGVAFYNGDLYVAEINRVIKFTDITHHLKNSKYTVITDKLPKESHHGWRYIRFSPDGWLYLSIGVPCNICVNKDERFGTILRMRPDGTHQEIFAKGVRNSVGFDWDPTDNSLWFTDNGRDLLGDNLPPDELNHAPTQNMNFGFPYFYGNNIPDPTFATVKSSKGMTPPAMNLGPHVAALGMSFFQGNILIAEHGSWNRSKKIGYRITQVILKNNKAVSYKPFITGWLQGEKEWGRPVDLKVLKDDSILISDDLAGVVYRLFKRGKS